MSGAIEILMSIILTIETVVALVPNVFGTGKSYWRE